jgi:hypothetical protein
MTMLFYWSKNQKAMNIIIDEAMIKISKQQILFMKEMAEG